MFNQFVTNIKIKIIESILINDSDYNTAIRNTCTDYNKEYFSKKLLKAFFEAYHSEVSAPANVTNQAAKFNLVAPSLFRLPVSNLFRKRIGNIYSSNTIPWSLYYANEDCFYVEILTDTSDINFVTYAKTPATDFETEKFESFLNDESLEIKTKEKIFNFINKKHFLSFVDMIFDSNLTEFIYQKSLKLGSREKKVDGISSVIILELPFSQINDVNSELLIIRELFILNNKKTSAYRAASLETPNLMKIQDLVNPKILSLSLRSQDITLEMEKLRLELNKVNNELYDLKRNIFKKTKEEILIEENNSSAYNKDRFMELKKKYKLFQI